MTTTTFFQIIAGVLTALFLYYGMDLRHRKGARDFIAPAWQTLMKCCSCLLIGVAAGTIFFLPAVNAGDWLALAVVAGGTAFVVAAKRGLGAAHTFTGQYLEKPSLVTRGVYAITRNPLYFGVFHCELGAAVLVVRHAPPLWQGIFALALVYAVSFNWTMAVREARYLESYFGEDYRRYSARTPFVFPLVRLVRR